MSYVDGYLLPIPKKGLKEYQKMANKAGKIWKEHGALDYRECVGEDLKIKGMASFTKVSGAKANEIVIFAYVLFKSKKHRDAVNAKVMKDPRIQEMCDSHTKMPFDVKRMAYGGFKTIVNLK